jgi:hypothetical protein
MQRMFAADTEWKTPCSAEFFPASSPSLTDISSGRFSRASSRPEPRPAGCIENESLKPSVVLGRVAH